MKHFEEIPVPEDLQERIEDALSAAILAEHGPQALSDAPRRRTPRWIWAAVPALAVCLAAILFVWRPIRKPADPAMTEAYARFEESFESFSGAVRSTYTVFSETP